MKVTVRGVAGRGARLLRHPLAIVQSARWAARAHGSVRRQLAGGGVTAVVEPPPPLPFESGGVHATLRLRRATCLERSVVLQRWLAAHGVYKDLVIGARTDAGGMEAHAWLDGETPSLAATYVEMTRVPPSVRAS